jgi:hypothetical protein
MLLRARNTTTAQIKSIKAKNLKALLRDILDVPFFSGEWYQDTSKQAGVQWGRKRCPTIKARPFSYISGQAGYV